MSTNFFWCKPNRGPALSRVHVGKKVEAGLYCWDCDETLHKAGKELMFQASPARRGESSVFEVCPRCAEEPDPMRIETKVREVRPSGVEPAYAFVWATKPEDARAYCLAHPDEVVARDTSESSYTGAQMLKMLEVDCPIEFRSSIGKNFS